MLIVYDMKQAAESETYPSTRIAPFKQSRYKKCIQAVLDVRFQNAGFGTACLVPGDMFLVFDGKKTGNQTKLKAPFINEAKDMPLQRAKRVITITYSEKGITDRRAVNRRGAASVKQNEHLHVFTRVRAKLPTRARRHFDGTSMGDTISGVPLPEATSQWMLSVARKRELYDKFRVPVGGKEESDDDDDDTEDEIADPTPKAGTLQHLHDFMLLECRLLCRFSCSRSVQAGRCASF